MGTKSVEINIQRIRERVQKGGHDVPEEDQLRRFPRSFANLKVAVPLADEVALFDNSSPEGNRLVAIRDGRGSSFFPPVPEWASGLDL